MECPHCGHAIIAGDDVCDHCQADLTEVDLPQPSQARSREGILEDTISQLDAPEAILLAKNDTVAKAVELMREKRFGSVLVIDDDGRLVGIFTEHDLLKQFAGSAREELARVPLSQAMTPDPQWLHEDDTLAHALNRMAVGGYRHIPVVDEEKPRRFVSVRGLLAYLAENTL